LFKQLGVQLPPRKEGQWIVPPVTDDGEDGDVVVKRLMASPPVTQQDRNKIKVARSNTQSFYGLPPTGRRCEMPEGGDLPTQWGDRANSPRAGVTSKLDRAGARAIDHDKRRIPGCEPLRHREMVQGDQADGNPH
jgi:hypothetical protein